jgi:hypothetical protein
MFRTPENGEQIKQRELARFEARESSWIERARSIMVELLLRSDREVSSDDVWKHCPPPADCHPSVMGPIFRSGLFVATGWRASRRPSAHARVTRTYRLKE